MGRNGVDNRGGNNVDTYLHNRTTVKQIGTTYGFSKMDRHMGSANFTSSTFSKLKNNIRNDVVF